ncbi:DUF421 domain-containing protein [Clostridium polynesiense]|uniref:DUF421 domain-containing protein n=1 Tax=Clostridium polynesiense TaxID=1325933 RepID=UPI000694E6B7|nr:YetF domain-containing protein [Clostridium polynesiense]
MNYALIIVKTIFIYLFMMFGLRLIGRKDMGELTMMDYVFILIISEFAGHSVLEGKEGFFEGVLAAAFLMVLNYVINYLFWKKPRLARKIEGEPMLLVYKGEVNHKNLKAERLALDDLMSNVRENGLTSLKEVELAILEKNGEISIIERK